jgi:hypothetical protein
MPKVELEATRETREATLDLAGAESIVDRTDAAVAAYVAGARELVFDLRTPGRPAVAILLAIEAVADALDAPGPAIVRCLVTSERSPRTCASGCALSSHPGLVEPRSR